MRRRYFALTSCVASCVALLAACGHEGAAPGSATAPTTKPKPNIAAADCRVGIEFEPAPPWSVQAGGENAVAVTVTVHNEGHATWNGDGPEMFLGAVWFKADKKDSNHAPNLGEQWWPLPATMAPGDTVKFDLMVIVPHEQGEYMAWFSALQSGVMWCYHTGNPPAKALVHVRP